MHLGIRTTREMVNNYYTTHVTVYVVRHVYTFYVVLSYTCLQVTFPMKHYDYTT